MPSELYKPSPEADVLPPEAPQVITPAPPAVIEAIGLRKAFGPTVAVNDLERRMILHALGRNCTVDVD